MITKLRTLLVAAALVAAATSPATASAPPAACADLTQEQLVAALTCAAADDAGWRAFVCAILISIAGTYGAVTITNQGDVYINSEPQFDCPPHDQ